MRFRELLWEKSKEDSFSKEVRFILNHIYKKIIILLLCAVMAVVFTGCKESLAFQQIEYNQDYQDVSNDDQLIDNQEEHQDEDEDLFSKNERDDAETERHYDESESTLDESQESNQKGASTTYNENAAASGVADGGNTGSAGSTGTTSGDSNISTDSGINTGENNKDSDLTAGNGNGSDIQGGDNKDDGDPVSYGEVMATGNAAILVQMFGGKGALFGTDASTLAAMQKYFPAEELEGILVLWNGSSADGVDGTQLNKLKETDALPEYCVLDASVLKEGDVSVLTKAGVTCQALQFDSYENMISSAESVASLLGSDQAAEQKAAYISFCQRIQEMVSEYSSSKYTLFVSDWDYDARLTITTKAGTWESVNGLAVGSRLSSSPADDMWSFAGINNNYSTSSKNYRGGNYLNNSSMLSYDYAYLCQLFCLPLTPMKTNLVYPIELYNNALLWGLGEDPYPALIVDTKEIRDTLLADKNYGSSTQSGGIMSVYPVNQNTHVLMINGSPTDALAYIQDDYEVYVNPYGLGDWVGGSPESILEAVWAAWRIQGTCTEDQVKDAVREFYSVFYRCDITDSQLNSILAGKEN